MKSCNKRECKKIYKTAKNNNNLNMQLEKCNRCVCLPGGNNSFATEQMIKTRNEIAFRWVREYWNQYRNY